jgi:hypothetical protein
LYATPLLDRPATHQSSTLPRSFFTHFSVLTDRSLPRSTSSLFPSSGLDAKPNTIIIVGGIVGCTRYYCDSPYFLPITSSPSTATPWIIRGVGQGTFGSSREWLDNQPRKGWTSGGHSSSLGQSGVRRGPIPTTNDPYYLYQISLHFRSTLTSSLKWLGRKAEHHHHCLGYCRLY